VAISAVEVVAALAGLFDGAADEYVDVGTGEMLLRVLVTIPIGTVAVEELIFRGSLHGLLTSVTSADRAMAAGAVLFGLWHVPAIAGDGVGTIVGTLAATTAAGVGFVWLRRRSDSLAAPILAHLATNSTAYALAWLVSR
jgi:membrane protease YdiL (CAAX protease family)